MGIVEEAIVLLFFISRLLPVPLLSPLCSFFSVDFSRSVSSVIKRDGVQYPPGLYRANDGKKEKESERVNEEGEEERGKMKKKERLGG